MDKWLQRAELVAGVVLTVYTLRVLTQRGGMLGAAGHGSCNKTAGYCFTHDKALG